MKKYLDFWEYMADIPEGYKKGYENLFYDLGVRNDLVWRNVVVICTQETFEKQGRKNYPQKATTTTYHAYTLDKYLNCLTGIFFFHDRIKKAYHKFGYIPYSMTCHNPDYTKRVRRSFEYVDVDEIYNKGGYREKNILDDLHDVSFDYSNGYKVIRFTDHEKNTFDYSMKTRNICG